MISEFEGTLDGSGLNIGIAVAGWNQALTDRLLKGALDSSERLGVTDVTVLRVPGALELPIAAQKLVDRGCHAVVAIGVIIKGETDHYEIVVRESTAGIARVALHSQAPVTNAILAVHDYSHAVERAGEGEANKGVEALEAAVLMATAIRALEQS